MKKGVVYSVGGFSRGRGGGKEETFGSDSRPL